MKQILLYPLIAIAAMIIAGCEKIIEFKGTASAPVLVVNSIVSPDSLIVAEVTASRFFLDDGTLKSIENADLRLIVNGEYKGELQVTLPGNHHYYIDHKVIPGDEVRIEAAAHGYASVSGTTVVPLKPSILHVDTASSFSRKYQRSESGWLQYDTVGEYRQQMVRFGVNFNDNGNTKNYYRLIVKKRTYFDPMNPPGGFIPEKGYEERMVTVFDDIVFGSAAQSGDTGDIFDEGSASDTDRFNVFSDEIFDGKAYKLTFSDPIVLDYVDRRDYSIEPRTNPDRTVYLIYLQEISPAYYLYVKSVVAARKIGSGDPFAEPVQVHSNVVNGIGLVGSYTSSEPYIVEFRHK